MSKYTISHSCGHDRTVNITGTDVHGERDRKALWLAARPCDTCNASARAAQREEDTEAAIASNAAAGLPPLEGTEKQVAWAEQIRARALATISDMARSSARDLLGPVMAVFTRAAAREPSASAWIDASGDPRQVIAAHMDSQDRRDLEDLHIMHVLAGKG